MKDLITAIASVTILMVFVLQFSSNFLISARIIIADKILQDYEVAQFGAEAGLNDLEIYKDKLARCFGCHKSQVLLEEKDKQYIVKAPLENIIVCADFLGIPKEENKALYIGVINKK